MADLGKFFNALSGGLDVGLGTYLNLTREEERKARQDRQDRQAAEDRDLRLSRQDAERKAEVDYAALLFEERPDMFDSFEEALAVVRSGGSMNALVKPEDPVDLAPEDLGMLTRRPGNQDEYRSSRDEFQRRYGELLEADPRAARRLLSAAQGMGFFSGPPREEGRLTPTEERQRAIAEAEGRAAELLLRYRGYGAEGGLPPGVDPEAIAALRGPGGGPNPATAPTFDPYQFGRDVKKARGGFTDPSHFNAALYGEIARLPEEQRQQFLRALIPPQPTRPVPPVPAGGLQLDPFAPPPSAKPHMILPPSPPRF
jgi:hypothetical protein